MKQLLNRVFWIFLFFFSMFLVSSCQDNSSTENDTQKKQEHVWKNQTDTIEKVKAVEGILQDSSEDLRQHIQDETK